MLTIPHLRPLTTLEFVYRVTELCIVGTRGDGTSLRSVGFSNYVTVSDMGGDYKLNLS